MTKKANNIANFEYIKHELSLCSKAISGLFEAFTLAFEKKDITILKNIKNKFQGAKNDNLLSAIKQLESKAIPTLNIKKSLANIFSEFQHKTNDDINSNFQFPKYSILGNIIDIDNSIIYNDSLKTQKLEYFEFAKIPAIANFADSYGFAINTSGSIDNISNDFLEKQLIKTASIIGVKNISISTIDFESYGRSISHVLELFPNEKVNVISSEDGLRNLLNDLENKIIDVGRRTKDKLYIFNEGKHIKIAYDFIVITNIDSLMNKIEPRQFEKILNIINDFSIASGIYFFIGGKDINQISALSLKLKKFIYINIGKDNVAKFSNLRIDFNDLTIKELANNLKINEENSNFNSNYINGIDLFNSIDFWLEKSILGLSAEVGIDDGGNSFAVDINDYHFNALIGGGSGKTVLLHSIILNLIKKYSPEELELILMDYKEGTEFAPYVNIPHTKAISLGSGTKFGRDILYNIVNEIENRGRLFREHQVNSFKSFREKGHSIPRILIIIDEFQRLLKDESYGEEARSSLEDIIRRGRSFGVNIILSSQSLMDNPLTQTTLQQILLRICLRMSEDESSRFLNNRNIVPSKFTQPGQAVANYEQGEPSRNKLFQVANYDRNAIDICMDSIMNYKKTIDYKNKEQFIYIDDSPIPIDVAMQSLKENQIALLFEMGLPPNIVKFNVAKKNKLFIGASESSLNSLNDYIDMLKFQYEGKNFSIVDLDNDNYDVFMNMEDNKVVYFLKIDENTDFKDLDNHYYDNKHSIKSDIIIYAEDSSFLRFLNDFRRDLGILVFMDKKSMFAGGYRVSMYKPINVEDIIVIKNEDEKIVGQRIKLKK